MRSVETQRGGELGGSGGKQRQMIDMKPVGSSEVFVYVFYV